MILTEQQLEPVLDEAMSQHDDGGTFVRAYTSGVIKSLIDNPMLYRSFGVYWWQLKAIFNRLGFVQFGDELETETLAKYELATDELACCAAFSVQQFRLSEHALQSPIFTLDIGNSEVMEYTLYDKRMEELAMMKALQKELS